LAWRSHLHCRILSIYISSSIAFSHENIRWRLPRVTLRDSFNLHLHLLVLNSRTTTFCNIVWWGHLLLLLLIVIFWLLISWSTTESLISCVGFLEMKFRLLTTFIKRLIIIIVDKLCSFLAHSTNSLLLLNLVTYHWAFWTSGSSQLRTVEIACVSGGFAKLILSILSIITASSNRLARTNNSNCWIRLKWLI
jgi:hypothetical protein